MASVYRECIICGEPITGGEVYEDAAVGISHRDCYLLNGAMFMSGQYDDLTIPEFRASVRREARKRREAPHD